MPGVTEQKAQFLAVCADARSRKRRNLLAAGRDATSRSRPPAIDRYMSCVDIADGKPEEQPIQGPRFVTYGRLGAFAANCYFDRDGIVNCDFHVTNPSP
jgi:hypothetical protein